MITRLLFIPFLFSIISVGGCVSELFYRGDGEFSDNGIFSYSNRYMIDLGDLDLSKPGIYNYVLSRLPKAEFVIGIDVEEDRPAATDGRRPDHASEIRLSLRAANEDLVIFEESSLNDWIWSHDQIDPVSNLYRRGKSRDIEYANGSTRSKRLGVKASGGWGTYFYTERFEEYILELEVLESSQYILRPAKLVVRGWNR